MNIYNILWHDSFVKKIILMNALFVVVKYLQITTAAQIPLLVKPISTNLVFIIPVCPT